MYLSDFHIHSKFSDGSLSIPEIVDLYGRAGFGAIAVTDHLCEQNTIGKFAHYLGKTLSEASFPFYMEILKSEAARAWDEYKMLLIPGVELTKNSLFNHRAAHVVALGIHSWVNPSLDFPEMCREIRDQGGLAIAAHPLTPHPVRNRPYYLWERHSDLKQHFDAWEITYGKDLLSEVIKSDLPKIASSDMHHPRQMKAWRTKLECRRQRDDIFAAIRRQELCFEFFEGEGILDWTQSLDLSSHRSHLGNLASA